MQALLDMAIGDLQALVARCKMVSITEDEEDGAQLVLETIEEAKESLRRVQAWKNDHKVCPAIIPPPPRAEHGQSSSSSVPLQQWG